MAGGLLRPSGLGKKKLLLGSQIYNIDGAGLGLRLGLMVGYSRARVGSFRIFITAHSRPWVVGGSGGAGPCPERH